MKKSLCGSLADPAFSVRYAESMFRLRFQTFSQRLQWDVQGENGIEYDRFDDADTRYVVVVDEEVNKVVGTWRLRPTSRPNMLADVFSSLLASQCPPADPRIWEISRLAVEESLSRTAFGLHSTARDLVIETTRFALCEGVTRFVMVVGVAVERLLHTTGIKIRRLSSPQRIGRVLTVACSLEVDSENIAAALGALGTERRAA